MSEPYNIGIDVSIDRLDVAIRPGGRAFCVTNDAAGWAELVAQLPRGAIAAIGLEPSGGYERDVVRILLAAGLSVRRINPNKLRRPPRRDPGGPVRSQTPSQILAVFCVPTQFSRDSATS